MAQRTEKEETEFKVVPENITLCVKCGVAGNYASATNNSCQKCFSTAAEASTSAVAVAAGGGTSTSTMMKGHAFGERSFRSSSTARVNLPPPTADLKREAAAAEEVVSPEAVSAVKREVSRCSGCRRKVGLTGFRCRCGELFCADHRYSDRHDCSFDYKSAGREAIARENPVVKAAKIVRI